MNSGIYDALRAKKYSNWKAWIYLGDLALSLAAILVFQFFLSLPLAGVLMRTIGNFYAALGVYITIFFGYLYVVTFPLRYAGSFFIEHRFSLSRQDLGAWTIDQIKSLVLSYVLLLFMMEIAYVLLRNFAGSWWLMLAAAWFFVSVIIARLTPVFLIPLFYKYSPIEDAGLKENILALSKRAGILIADVSQIDFSAKTSKANAAMTGMGKTRKVILTDNLIEGFTVPEIMTVTAHEFGHYRLGHIWRMLIFSLVSTLAAFYMLSRILSGISAMTGASGVSDLSFLPLFVLGISFFNIVLMPFGNYYSRRLERQADRFSLEITKDHASFVSMMKKLAETNLADMEPSAVKKMFFYDHPPIKERIEMAERYGAAAGGDVPGSPV